MSFIDAIKEQRAPKVAEEKGLMMFLLNIIPGLGTTIASFQTEDADNKIFGIIQLCLILVSWIWVVGWIIGAINWGVSMYWGYLMFKGSKA